METEKQTCRECQSRLPAGAPEGLCPKCLLERALQTREYSVVDPTVGPPGVFPSTPFTGTKLRYFGEYELLEEIAQGGMGVIFKARQVNLNRLVALKLIRSGALASPEMLKRFKAEAEAAAFLNHANIVPIHEIGQVSGQYYFSMGLIDGPNLHQFLKGGALAPARAATLIRVLARAVHHAHQYGVLHRDIKPSNVLIDRNETPFLSDFGLAKLVAQDSTLTHTNAILGTPAYMAPEQARGQMRTVTTAVDVYGLGAVFYECLTGCAPFAGGTTLETVRRVIEEEPRPPALLNAQVDPDLETICLKCLEKNPDRRYASAEALAQDLDRWERREPIEARPITGFERAVKWARRRPALAALSAVTLLAIAALIGVSISIPAYMEAEEARLTEFEARQKEVAQRKIAQRTLSALKYESYINRLNLAEREIAAGDWPAAEASLDACPPELRAWEWRYFKQLCAQFPQSSATNSRVISRETNLFNVSFDQRGSRLLSIGDLIVIFDPATGEKLYEFPSNRGTHGRSAISPDGKQYAYSTYGYDNLFGSVELGIERAIADHRIADVAFSPDGMLLGSCDSVYGTNVVEANLWQAGTGEMLRVLDRSTNGYTAIAFSPDGKLVAIAEGNYQDSQFIWDTPMFRKVVKVMKITGELVQEFTGHKFAIWRLRFTPDSKRLVSAGGLYSNEVPGEIKVWDLGSGTHAMELRGHKSCVFALAISPDGSRVAAAGGVDRPDGIHLWDLSSGRYLSALHGHTDAIYDLAFCQNGSYLASASADLTVRVWDGTPLPPEHQIDLSGTVSSPLISSEGNWPEDRFANFPQGLQRLGGVRFDIREMIVLRPPKSRYWDRPKDPEAVTSIPVSRHCTSLHFLHGARTIGPSANQGGSFVAHYADGRRHEATLTLDESRSKLVWSAGPHAEATRVFKTTWTNPLPTVEIQTLELSATQSGGAPFILGFTAR